MKPAELWTYALLLAVTAAFAHHSWTAEDTQAKTEVLVFDPGSAGLDRIEWWGARNAATVEINGEEDDPDIWLTAGKRPRLSAPKPAPAVGDDDDSGAAGGSQAKPDAPEYGDPELVSFPGSKAARDLVGRYLPLKALRQFDDLSQEQLEGMGLAAPEERLTLSAGSRTLVMEVGSKAYGSSDTYARKEGASTVWLLSSKTVGPLRSASTSLRDRNIFGFEAADAATAALLPAGQTEPLTLYHHGRHDKDNSYWSRNEDPQERDSVSDGFVKKVFQLKATSYLKQTDIPQEDSLETLFLTIFYEQGESLSSVEVARAVDSAKSRDGEMAYIWYARSPRTRQNWVKVSRSVAQELNDGLSSLR